MSQRAIRLEEEGCGVNVGVVVMEVDFAQGGFKSHKGSKALPNAAEGGWATD
jgi:hypothetical protein